MTDAFDPLDYENLAKSIVTALIEREPKTLPPAESFCGSGVYAIYYIGELPYYRRIASRDFTTPIYVGKAIPKGGRKGGESGKESAELCGRLRQHAKSIEQVENLELADFRCRYLVVVPVWISLAERFLIQHYRPLWNTVLDGFGNHDPGKGRGAMRRPRWDVLHPGRPWAAKLAAVDTRDALAALAESSTA